LVESMLTKTEHTTASRKSLPVCCLLAFITSSVFLLLDGSARPERALWQVWGGHSFFLKKPATPKNGSCI